MINSGVLDTRHSSCRCVYPAANQIVIAVGRVGHSSIVRAYASASASARSPGWQAARSGGGGGGLRSRSDRLRVYRHLQSAGIRCEVVAPSKLQRPAGDLVKTDARDAVHMARLLRLEEVTAVAIPTVDQEAARDLVRAREDRRSDLIRARHRLTRLLQRHGIAYSGGAAWTGARPGAAPRRACGADLTSDPAELRRGLRCRVDREGSTRPAGRGDRAAGRRFRVHPGFAFLSRGSGRRSPESPTELPASR